MYESDTGFVASIHDDVMRNSRVVDDSLTGDDVIGGVGGEFHVLAHVGGLHSGYLHVVDHQWDRLHICYMSWYTIILRYTHTRIHM